MTDTIKITKQTDAGGCLYVEGELLRFEGWTFSATVKPEPDHFSSCWACDFGRVVEVSLYYCGKLFASCPGECPRLGDDHNAMFDQIDRFFPPSPEERKTTAGYRARLLRDSANVLYSLVKEHCHASFDDELIRDAAAHLADSLARRLNSQDTRT